jgi:hypothetical protein
VWQPRYSNGSTDDQGRPIIIGTSAWEAAQRELWAHHSITNPPGPNATLEQDCEHMRAFEAIGQARFGEGISYTWVIMPSGRVFEGHSIDRRGTHTYQRNDRSRAVCFAGNFDVAALPDRMVHAAALLLREINATFDGGHRDVYPTACPGQHAYGRLPEINRLATSGEPLSVEDCMSIFTEASKKAYDEAYVDIKALKALLIGDVSKDTLPALQRHVNFIVEELTRRTGPRFAAIEARIDALGGTLGDDEAKLLAAIRSQPTGGQVDVAQLATALAPLLPQGVTPDQVQDALRTVLRTGVDDDKETDPS